jgi:hypothetical protein
MKSWTARVGLVLAMLAMVLAVSIPAMADDAEDLVDDLLEEEELSASDLEDCVLDDDGDGLTDEELENLIDDDGDALVDEDLEVTCTTTFEADDFEDEDE